jgi:hypothetical protein
MIFDDFLMILRIQGDTRDIVLQKSVWTLVSRTIEFWLGFFYFGYQEELFSAKLSILGLWVSEI